MITDAKQKGFIALVSILIVGVLVLVIVLGVLLRSVSQSQMSIAEQESYKALALANLCAEQALMKLKSVLQYGGNESIIIDGDVCDILAVEGTGNLNRTVKASSTVSFYTRKVEVQVSQISPSMQILSWKEVADF